MCINKVPLLFQLLLPCKRSYNIFYCLSANKKPNIQHMAPSPASTAPATWSASAFRKELFEISIMYVSFLLFAFSSIYNLMLYAEQAAAHPAPHFHISKTLPFVEQIIQTSHFRDGSPQVLAKHTHWTL